LNWRAGAATSLEILRGHPLRSLLSISGLVLGVLGVVLVTALGKGARINLEERLAALGKDLIVVSAGESRMRGGKLRRVSRAKTLTPADALALRRRLSSVGRSAGSLKLSVILSHRGRKVKTTLMGLEPQGFAIRRLVPGLGRLYGPAEERARRRVLVLGPTVARNLLGAKDPLGAKVAIAGAAYQVLGVAEEKGSDLNGSDLDDTVYVPLRTTLRRLAKQNHVETIYLQGAPGYSLHQVQTDARQLLRRRHRLHPEQADDFSLHNQLELLRLHGSTERTLTRLLAGAATLSWLIGGVGIFVVMVLSVRERRGEIGLRRALGARRKDILWQFLLEAALLGGVGGLGGLALGIGLAFSLDATQLAPASPEWGLSLASLAASLLVGLLSGWLPAQKAAGLDPVHALSSSG
jgi:putative ABC transport system permease protein